jgi:flagellar protein FliJ
MSRFKLSGLLRARTVQEEQARRELGAAQTRLSAAGTAVQHRQAALAAAGGPPSGSASVFLAGVAARAGMAASVGEALALREACDDGLQEARSEWLQARMRARAIERLAERDRAQRLLERGRAEQALSDDRAGARHSSQASARAEADAAAAATSERGRS